MSDDIEDLKLEARRLSNRIEDIEEQKQQYLREAGKPGVLPEGHRIVREMPAQKPGRSRQDYATPVELIKAVENYFGPLVHDLAAHAGNFRCPTYYSPEQDSLKQSWAKDFPKGNLWLNPPFDNITPWARKCFEESRLRDGLIIFLTPASVGSEWFADYVELSAFVMPLRPRISFDGVNSYPKDCMVSVWGLGCTGFRTWRWKT